VTATPRSQPSGARARLFDVVVGGPGRFIRDWMRRFVGIQGVDRATALGGQAFTALFPILIVYATVVPGRDSRDFAESVIDRFNLAGAAAASVRRAFAPAGTVEDSVTALGVVLLIVSALSFTRALQRVYESAQGLPPLGVRSTPYGLAWLAFIGLELMVRPVLVDAFGTVWSLVVALALNAVVWLVTPYLLLARRLAPRRLAPTSLLTTFGVTCVGVAAIIGMPETVEASAEQFGVIGVAFALLTWLIGSGFAIVIAAAGGAVIDDRLERRRHS
jgi:membrane protein